MTGWSDSSPVQDVYDNVTYLQSLGKAQTAAVKRDAEIGVAQVSISWKKSSTFGAKYPLIWVKDRIRILYSKFLSLFPQANRDAGIREAECEKAAMDVKYSTGSSGIHSVLFFFFSEEQNKNQNQLINSKFLT